MKLVDDVLLEFIDGKTGLMILWFNEQLEQRLQINLNPKMRKFALKIPFGPLLDEKNIVTGYKKFVKGGIFTINKTSINWLVKALSNVRLNNKM